MQLWWAEESSYSNSSVYIYLNKYDSLDFEAGFWHNKNTLLAIESVLNSSEA